MPENGFSGIDGMLGVLRKFDDDAKKGRKKGTLLALRNVLNESNRHVPHEEGDLERDGGISYDEATDRGAVSYGRTAETRDYAVEQHERLDFQHDSGRHAKFLEQAFAKTREENLRIIQTQIRRATGT